MKSIPYSRTAISLLMIICFHAVSWSQDHSEEDQKVRELIYKFGMRGYEHIQYNINLDSAEFYLTKALDLAYQSSNYIIDERVANYHVLLASVYRTIYDNTKALYHLNEAEKILDKVAPESIYLASLYHNKGNIYKSRNDFYRTKEYYEFALDFMIKHGYQNTDDFAFVFSNYISLLFELKEDKLAEEQLARINLTKLEISPFISHRIQITYANAYSQLDKYDLAESYFKKAQQIIDKQGDITEYTNQIIKYYYNIIDFYIYYNKYDKALRECDNAFSYIESLDPRSTKSKITFHADILYRAASVYFRIGNLDKALKLSNMGIDALNEFLSELSYGDDNITKRNQFITAIPELFILRSRILFAYYLQSSTPEKLTETYKSYKESIETLNYMKLAMNDEKSKLYATSQILEVYYEAIYVGKMLYELTGEFEYLQQSFEFAETSKSFALYSEIKDVEAMQFSDLPAEIKQKENRFMGEIQAYEEWLYDEQLSEEPDQHKIDFYKERLFHLKDDYNDLKQDIETNYAQYYELKYNPTFVTLKDVQNDISYRDALVEYVLSDTLLITYVIDRKGINVFSQEIGPEFSDECLEYYMLLHNQNFSGGVRENYRRFVSLGRKFYNILIEPCLRYTDRKNFTIVPDGAITYIPFEGLMTKDTDTEYINYLNLPYMIREFSVGYSHSSTLMFSKRLKTKSTENKVLAFAPAYKNELYSLDSLTFRQAKGNIEYLAPLPGIIKEVQSIKETVPARVFINDQATEANFKKYASDYNVLHLAMHTIMRDDNPLYSLLVFTNVETRDSIEDNRLYAYEIYNMKLNAQMAVLSSCNSGFGKMQKGEGMMSLARGFIYAGCPSIVMTLWQVADKSSSELMTSFYKYLKRGRSKQEAMRMAKTDYLKKADELTSNPYFWSGFVVLGDNSPVYRKSGIAYWMIIITLFIGLVLFFQYKKS